MDKELLRRINDVFNEAVELPPEERPAFLDQSCADDPVFRREVEHVLQAYEHGPSLPANPLLSGAHTEETILACGTLLQGRYRVTRVIRTGGMGTVYEAKDTAPGLGPDRKVALKQAKPAFRHIFEREVKILSGLNHENLPQVHDLIHEGEERILVMQYIEGETLDDLLQRRDRPFEPGKVLTWAGVLLRAIDYLHTFEPSDKTIRREEVEPILHRDIKPSNLMLTRGGHLYLLDFGIAKSGVLHLTREGTAEGFGTHAYAPPEQLRGEPTTVRSDLYALGATLYRLLTKELPPPADSRAFARERRLDDPLALALADRKEIPGDVARWLQRAMALEPSDRPASARDMLAELGKITDASKQPSRRRRILLFICSVALVFALAGYLWYHNQAADQAAEQPATHGPVATPDPGRAPDEAPAIDVSGEEGSTASQQDASQSPPGAREPISDADLRTPNDQEDGNTQVNDASSVSTTPTPREPPQEPDGTGEDTSLADKVESTNDGDKKDPASPIEPGAETKRGTVRAVETNFAITGAGGSRGVILIDGHSLSVRSGYPLSVGVHRMTVHREGYEIQKATVRYRQQGAPVEDEVFPEAGVITLRVEATMSDMRIIFHLRAL